MLVFLICICAYVHMGLEITLGKWLMLGAYIRAPPPRGGARTGASETRPVIRSRGIIFPSRCITS